MLLIPRIDSEQFTLAGYSMGGRIALHVALTIPERVAARIASRRCALLSARLALADGSADLRTGTLMSDAIVRGRLRSSARCFVLIDCLRPSLTGQSVIFCYLIRCGLSQHHKLYNMTD